MARTVSSRIIKRFNWLFDRRFRLELRIKQENERYDARQATLQRQHAARLQKLTEQAEALDRNLVAEIDEHRAELIPAGRRSFVTANGKVQLRLINEHIVILDKRAIMKKAAVWGMIRKIADPPRGGWHFNLNKFRQLIESDDKAREKFADCIEVVAEDESITLQPNTGYTVEYSGRRLSPPSIRIK